MIYSQHYFSQKPQNLLNFETKNVQTFSES